MTVSQLEMKKKQYNQLNEWVSHLNIDAPHSSNQPSINLPYQRWFRFKEAYSPKLVIDIINKVGEIPSHVFDPFGGCGTTAVTSQFLGVTPTAIEVNPFLADLTQSKLTRYNFEQLLREKDTLNLHIDSVEVSEAEIEKYPRTFCEPGFKERWLFPAIVFKRILQYKECIKRIEDEDCKRLFRVILGSTLIPVSNVFISGKGRKYKQNWELKQSTAKDLDKLFNQNLQRALHDIAAFNEKHSGYKLLRGDCREQVKYIEQFDFSMFSPPYPNSFDYTDVYNVELWLLGYIGSHDDCRDLRSNTLRSHVQVRRTYENKNAQSNLMNETLAHLELHREELWHKELPEMIGAYFCDLAGLLEEMRTKITENGNIIMIVGDSAYKSVRVPVADILAEIALTKGYKIKEKSILRKLRVSAQQGGDSSLDESMLWIQPI
ncbi:DNA methylase N-4/N-6 [Vibrio fluvialis]|nr:DNA methylase N-4/N-6 [Vibrio fluvialis]